MTRTAGNTGRTPMLRDSVEQVWLAGLGALALTEEEGLRFFRRLVKKGEGFEKQTRAQLEKTMARARKAPAEAMDRIEVQFDETRNGALSRLGVPTSREIESLRRRVEGLAESLETGKGATRRGTTPRRKVAATKRSATARSATARSTTKRAGTRTAARTTKPTATRSA